VRILITGATGFVGRRLTQKLVDEGHEVTITSSGTGPHALGVKKILYRGFEGIDWTYLHGQDVVFHQFANNDTRCQDESEMFRANVYGAIKMFVSAINGGCKNFVYASSTAVYGSEPAPYVEGVTEVKPLNVYGHSKAKFDEFAMQFAKDYKVKVTGLRYCNVYGPGESHKGKRMSMIGQLMRDMLAKKTPKLFEFGEQKRDWIYVDDVVKMNMLAMNRTQGEDGEIYNCGSGKASTFNDIVNTIQNAMCDQKLIHLEEMYTLAPEYILCPFSAEYQNHTECGIEKAKQQLGFEPSYNLRDGIEEYLKELVALSA
jgi:ADP-L-glycero-D-manno-heptose 6-epimerase